MSKLIDSIRPGDRVTIVDRFGKKRTGRAVMRGPHGYVLNMGSKHGRPGIASDSNTTRVRAGRKRSYLGAVVRKRCEVFVIENARSKKMEYAGSFTTCTAAKDYAEYLRKSGYKASVRKKG